MPGMVQTAARLLRTAPAIAASPQTLPNLGGLRFVCLYVGAPGRVLDTYEDALKIDYRGFWVSVNLWSSPYASIRKAERFKAFVRAAGMVDYWRAKGWPEFCRPFGTDESVWIEGRDLPTANGRISTASVGSVSVKLRHYRLVASLARCGNLT